MPNTSPVPNFIFDLILQDTEFPESALRVLFFLLRKTIGWNKTSDLQSLDDIVNGTSLSVMTVRYGVALLCDCFEFFAVTKGTGHRKSKFIIRTRNLTEEHYIESINILINIYNKEIPTAKELKEKPCTQELLAYGRKVEDLERKKDAEEAEKRKQLSADAARKGSS
jgi:hypothetical protein